MILLVIISHNLLFLKKALQQIIIIYRSDSSVYFCCSWKKNPKHYNSMLWIFLTTIQILVFERITGFCRYPFDSFADPVNRNCCDTPFQYKRCTRCYGCCSKQNRCNHCCNSFLNYLRYILWLQLMLTLYLYQ